MDDQEKINIHIVDAIVNTVNAIDEIDRKIMGFISSMDEHRRLINARKELDSRLMELNSLLEYALK